MKQIIVLIAFFFSLNASATGPCARTEPATEITSSTQSLPNGNLWFHGNFDPKPFNSFAHKQITFEGTMYVSPISLDEQRVYTHGVFFFEKINMVSSAFYAGGSSDIYVTEFNLDKNSAIYFDESYNSTLYIGGKPYKIGDTYKGVKILACNPNWQPATPGNKDQCNITKFTSTDVRISSNGQKLEFRWKTEYESDVKEFLIQSAKDCKSDKWCDVSKQTKLPALNNPEGGSYERSYLTCFSWDEILYCSLPIAFIGFGFRRRRNALIGMVALGVVTAATFIGCRKHSPVPEYATTLYYRVVAVGTDGCKQYSDCMKIK